MAVGFIIKTKLDTALVKSGLQNLEKKIPRVGRNQIYQVMLKSRTKLRKPGKKPTYPIKWDSVRQKIKVIIILRYTLGMPYTRTGAYQKAFTIKSLRTGYEMVNTTERAQFISGDATGQGQSRIHKGRYPIMRKVIDTEMKKLPKEVIKHIELVAKEEGFETGE